MWPKINNVYEIETRMVWERKLSLWGVGFVAVQKQKKSKQNKAKQTKWTVWNGYAKLNSRQLKVLRLIYI